jgi:hypothetical protein
MDAQKVAAHFVAFTFILNQERHVLLHDAGRFARRHWQDFLPYASEDLASFLTKNPGEFSRPVTKGRPPRTAVKRQLAAVN